MRLILSKASKKKLFQILKKRYGARSLHDLSLKTGISQKTLDGWFYLKERSVPEYLLRNTKIKVAESRNDNWGQVEGGKKGYMLAVKKYGTEGLRLKQSLGGKKAAKTKAAYAQVFAVDIKDPRFLEFYGALLGDGWLSHFKYENKNIWLVGLCGNLSLDKEFVFYIRENVKKLFNRDGYIRKKPKGNTIELVFKHKELVTFLKNVLHFPIGKKENLQIHTTIYTLGYENIKYVIRGIFDTDGSFYLEKNRSGSPHPCISIHMKAPTLIRQIGDILKANGFKCSYSNNGNQIRLRGRKQLIKWMKEIGSSNPKHLNKINSLVAEIGLQY